MSIITLGIAALLLVGALILAFTLPHPLTWLIAVILGAIFFLVLLPKYQGEQKALSNGQDVVARVEKVRFWSRKYGDGRFLDQYEINAVWQNPRNGQTVRFISPPLKIDPEPFLKDKTVKVKVNPDNPTQYVMDLSFLPKQNQ